MSQHDAITYAAKIEQKINEIETLIDSVQDAADNKALGIANYDRVLAITILKIKNGIIATMEDIDGNTIEIPKNLAQNLIEKIARGIVYQEAYNKESGDAGYKGLITMIEAKKASLNGLQSINKVLQ